MRLANANRFFEKQSFRDAYTNALLFKGTIAPFRGQAVSGTLTQKRVLTIDPTINIPTRRALKSVNEVWLVGKPVTDTFESVSLRSIYATAYCTALYTLLTPGQAALGITTGCTQAWGQANFSRSTTETETSSAHQTLYLTLFSNTETFTEGGFIQGPDGLYHIRNTYEELEGFTAVESDDAALSTTSVTFNSGAYNPITDSFSSGTVVTTGVFMDMYQFYEYPTDATPHRSSGDKALVVAQSSITPVNGNTVVIGPDSWRVLAFTPVADAWLIHLRRL